MHNKQLILLLALGLLLAALSLTFFSSVSADAGAYLTVANGVLKGKLPYLDYFDHKPPGVYYTLALFLFLGKSLYAVRLGVMAFHLAAAFVVFILGRRLWGQTWGIIAGLFYLMGALVFVGTQPFIEPFMPLFFALAALFYLKHADSGSMSYVLLAGLWVGLAFTFKPTAIQVFLPLLLLLLAWPYRRGWGYRLKAAVIFSGCSAVPMGLTALYFWGQGAFPDFVEQVFLANTGYVTGRPFRWTAIPPGTLLAHLRDGVYGFPLLLVLSVSATAVVLRQWLTDRRYSSEFSLTVLFLFNVVPLLYWISPRYYLLPLPFASLLGALAARELWGWSRGLRDSSGFNYAKVAAPLALLALLGFSLNRIAMEHWGLFSSHVWYQQEIGSYIKAVTSPGERIFIFPSMARFYFFSGREPMDKNIYLHPVNFRRAFTAESIIAKLRRERVRYILAADPSYISLAELSIVYAFIVDNYVVEKEFPPDMKLYRLPPR